MSVGLHRLGGVCNLFKKVINIPQLCYIMLRLQRKKPTARYDSGAICTSKIQFREGISCPASFYLVNLLHIWENSRLPAGNHCSESQGFYIKIAVLEVRLSFAIKENHKSSEES